MQIALDSPLALAKALINQPSVTPKDAGCQALIQSALSALPFEWKQFDTHGVQNSVGMLELGIDGPCFVFAGHTDVVPAGKQSDWHTDPFCATEKDGRLYGRGAADMKGALAAMVCAIQRFYRKRVANIRLNTGLASGASRPLPGRIGLMLTSDEEGPARYGTRHIMECLKADGTQIDYCLIGEPTSVYKLGDTVKVGRRGSLTARLKILGRQGHVGYPHLADNAIHRSLSFMQIAASHTWDKGNADFEPTRLQITDVRAGMQVGNVIPGEIDIDFNLRFCPENTVESIQTQVADWLASAQLAHTLEWTVHGRPYYSSHPDFLAACAHAVETHVGIQPAFTTHGGASDGRFIAPAGIPVIELGLVADQIHGPNEATRLEDLNRLTDIYVSILDRLFVTESR